MLVKVMCGVNREYEEEKSKGKDEKEMRLMNFDEQVRLWEQGCFQVPSPGWERVRVRGNHDALTDFDRQSS